MHQTDKVSIRLTMTSIQGVIGRIRQKWLSHRVAYAASFHLDQDESFLGFFYRDMFDCPRCAGSVKNHSSAGFGDGRCHLSCVKRWRGYFFLFLLILERNIYICVCYK